MYPADRQMYPGVHVRQVGILCYTVLAYKARSSYDNTS